MVGVGGIIFYLGGNTKAKFAWVLGTTSNNMAKALALFQGIKLLLSLNIKEVDILGDSWILIRSLNFFNAPPSYTMASMVLRIKGLLSQFSSYKCYHILRTHNSEEDRLVNAGSTLPLGSYLLNDSISSFVPIP